MVWVSGKIQRRMPGRNANRRIPPNPTDKQNVGFWGTTRGLLQLEPVGWVVWVNRNLNRRMPGWNANRRIPPNSPGGMPTGAHTTQPDPERYTGYGRVNTQNQRKYPPVFRCAPTGIRTPVLALKGLRPGPLDDGGIETGILPKIGKSASGKRILIRK